MGEIRIGNRYQLGIGFVRQGKYAVTRLEVLYVRAYSMHDTAHIAPQDGWKRQGEILLARPGTNLPVDWIHACRRRGDQYGISAHLRISDLVFKLQLLRTAILMQNYCLHLISPLLPLTTGILAL